MCRSPSSLLSAIINDVHSIRKVLTTGIAKAVTTFSLDGLSNIFPDVSAQNQIAESVASGKTSLMAWTSCSSQISQRLRVLYVTSTDPR